MRKPLLSVVIPCYNEIENLKRGVLDQVENYLKKQSFASEVIISDDESTDGSLDFTKHYVKKNKRFRHLENHHGGKPFAIRSGLKAAKGKVVLVMDMDQSTPIDQFTKLKPFFDKGYQVVIGSRGQDREGFSLLRKIASRVFIILRKSLLLPQITDTQCGFKAFINEAAHDLFSRLMIFKNSQETSGWKVGAFDVELLFIAQKRGYRIAEVPVKWKDEDLSAESKGIRGKFIKESKEMLFEVFRVKINDLKGKY